ncbi:ABC1 domain-containing protein [Coccidioides immitis H538.4]|uniref:ABC1 domain-containing protein n=1 Tax=Coccidioides immitis H538.4 TaxID=396776 RepID=A0A0J8RH96_COCIT|nr:ABC1 domain-containing protein [Coccidioides immitis H538.4]
MQSAILPPEFQKMFSRMFDDAPQNDWKDVARVIEEDFGKPAEEVFGVSFSGDPSRGVMERTARASASVAQVHWAKLSDGREVAIKIQKKEIATQVKWDLWAFKIITWVYSRVFDIPFYSLVPFVSERRFLETDFENEADKLSEWPSLSRPSRGSEIDTSTPERLKPGREYWKGRARRGGLGLSLNEVMTTMVDLFSAQMFLWGWLHCDPHPGNWFVRRQPNGKAELVLIDHGLYVHMEPNFRHQYARLWKALLTFDNNSITKIVNDWGVNNADLFASATLLRPYQGGERTTSKALEGLSKKDRAKLQYEMQQAMRKAVREILGDETRWPRELIFISRNMRIVQANNQFLGSPVNRIKITGTWASRALVESADLPLLEKIKKYGRHIVFRFVLLSSDILFYWYRIRQMLGWGGGMEDEIESSNATYGKGYGSRAEPTYI